MRYLMFFLSILFVSQGCATRYRYIHPATLEYKEAADTLLLPTGELIVSWQYNVLKKSRNKRYARNEKYFRISLLAMSITNLSADTFYIPENLDIWREEEYLHPLYLEEAKEALRQTFVEENGDIETGDFFSDIVYFIFNASVQGKANKRFEQELDDYYLLYTYIPPGEAVAGLLALPVKRNAPLRFTLNSRAEVPQY